MSKHSLDDDLKPREVFVEDAESQVRHLGDYSRNVNARCVLGGLGGSSVLVTADLFIYRIYNPLSGITKDDLYDRVLRFCQEYGFEEHVETFQKGALVAQRPKEFEELSELTDDDKYYLRRETTRMSSLILC
jgi:hypothetical protein